MSNHTGLPLQYRIIKTLEEGLKAYSLRETANPVFIQKQNELIQNLVAVYNHFERLTDFDTWLCIEKEIRRLERLDPGINGHVIHLQISPGDNHTHIDLNLYEPC